MRLWSRAALALLANLIALSPAAASGFDAGQPEARLSWRLGFGGAAGRVETGYGLALGMRGGFGDDFSALAELDVNDGAALARLAGMPLYARGWQVSQAEETAPAGQAGASPWYGRKWVWWTAGGLALTAAAAGGGGSDTQTTCTGICNQSGNDNGNGMNGVSGTINGPGDTHVCVLEGAPGTPDLCADAFVERHAGLAGLPGLPGAELDAGTGGMGDLIAR